ncbi:MAG: hypothetical protein IPL59_09555 [Candidatus Competibacteraceae bacterium]|nr:hypothetical protein [Candidatus Contendobacter odensis]MBK8535348.1 hypothetical protein [Candidatus Competibacteraceae bacterium]MBK8753852.1 hypothetical protein [Candidatus Competibacteraceae bacterium]
MSTCQRLGRREWLFPGCQSGITHIEYSPPIQTSPANPSITFAAHAGSTLQSNAVAILTAIMSNGTSSK